VIFLVAFLLSYSLELFVDLFIVVRFQLYVCIEDK